MPRMPERSEPGWEKAILDALPSGIDLVQLERALALTPTERLEQMRLVLLQLREATIAPGSDRLPRTD
jgi:hypothetical protein